MLYFILGVIVGQIFLIERDNYRDYKEGKKDASLVRNGVSYRSLKTQATTALLTDRKRKWYWRGILAEFKEPKYAIWY